MVWEMQTIQLEHQRYATLISRRTSKDTTASTNLTNTHTHLSIQIHVGPGPTESCRHPAEGDETTEEGATAGGDVQEQPDGAPRGYAFRKQLGAHLWVEAGGLSSSSRRRGGIVVVVAAAVDGS